MRVAVISDIHGNWPALQAVFQDFVEIDICVCCGDVVGYYPFVNEVCAALRERSVFVVRGNHDGFAIRQLRPDPAKAQAYRVAWTRKHLSKEHLQWLTTLPVEMSFRWERRAITMRHASPWDEETYLYSDSAELQNIHLEEGTIAIFGHTHHPMHVKCGKGVVVNPGSVGQPRDWNPDPCYAILDTVSGKLEFRRVQYDVKKLQVDLRRNNWESTSIELLGRRQTAR